MADICIVNADKAVFTMEYKVISNMALSTTIVMGVV